MPQPENLQQSASETGEAHEATVFSAELRSLNRIVGDPPAPLPETPSTQELTELEAKNTEDHRFESFNEQYQNNRLFHLRGSLDRTKVLREGTPEEKNALNIPECIVVNQAAAYHEYFASAVNHVTAVLQRYEQLRVMTPNVPPELESHEAMARLYVGALERNIQERVTFANAVLVDALQKDPRYASHAQKLLNDRNQYLTALPEETRNVLQSGSPPDIRRMGNTLNQRIIDILAGKGRMEGVPEGFLPQRLYLDLLTHRYKTFLELQEAIAKDPTAGRAMERHRVLQEKNERAKRSLGDPLTAQEGEEYAHLQRVLRDHEGELERMGGQRRATTEELIDFTDDLARFQMNMAETAQTQNQFGINFDLTGANPVNPDQTPEEVREAIGINMQRRAGFHIERTQQFLGRVEEDILHEGLKEKIENAWNKNGREGVREVSNALARFFTIPVPETLGLKEEAQQALAGPLNEALGWPIEKRDMPWEALTPEEQKTVHDRSKSVLDAIREFDRTKIERYRETSNAIRILPPASEFAGQEILQPLPDVRVTAQNLDAMIAAHGGATVYALLFQQLEGDWGTTEPPSGFIGEYGNFFHKVDKVVDIHIDVGSALFEQQQAYTALRDSLFYAMLAALGTGIVIGALGAYVTGRILKAAGRGTVRMGGNVIRRTWSGRRSSIAPSQVSEVAAPGAEGAARANQLTRMRHIDQERAIARYIQESKIGQRISQLRTFRFLSAASNSRPVAALGKSARVVGTLAVPAITAYQLYDNENRVSDATEHKNKDLADVYKGRRSTIALEGAGVGATLLLPGVMGPLALAGSVVYAGKHAMNRSEVRADWAKTSKDWQRELGPIGSRQKLRDTTFGNAVEAGGGGVLRTRIGTWIDSKEERRKTMNSLDQAQIGARREIYQAYFEDVTLVPANSSPTERKEAVDDRMQCIHILTSGRYENVTDSQLQMADAYAEVRSKARNFEKMGFAKTLSYIDNQGVQQYIDLQALENPTAQQLSQVVTPFLNHVRPVEDLLKFESWGDIGRRNGNEKNKALSREHVRTALLQRLTHRIMNAERSIVVTDWSGVDLPFGITTGNTQSQNIVRAALRKRLEMEIEPLTDKLIAGDLTPQTYPASIRKIESIFQEFQNAGDSNVRLESAMKDLSTDEKAKAAALQTNVLMELLL